MYESKGPDSGNVTNYVFMGHPKNKKLSGDIATSTMYKANTRNLLFPMKVNGPN